MTKYTISPATFGCEKTVDGLDALLDAASEMLRKHGLWVTVESDEFCEDVQLNRGNSRADALEKISWAMRNADFKDHFLAEQYDKPRSD